MIENKTHPIGREIKLFKRTFILEYIGWNVVQRMMCIIQYENVIAIGLCSFAGAIEARPPRHIYQLFRQRLRLRRIK